MKTEKEVLKRIKQIKKDRAYLLTGGKSTIVENAPRALMQLETETVLGTLRWVLTDKGKEKKQQ